MFLADRVAGSLFGCTWPRNGHGSSRCRQRVLQPARELQWREALARVEIVLTRVISWSAKANAFVARDPARPSVLARGATLAEAARKLAAAVEPPAGKPLLAAVDAIQREVARKRLRLSRKEIAAEVRATRAERRRRG